MVARKPAPLKEAVKKEEPKAASAVSDPVVEDGGRAELQAIWDDALSKGYFGIVPDKVPNEKYSLASGPDGPPVNPPKEG